MGHSRPRNHRNRDFLSWEEVFVPSYRIDPNGIALHKGRIMSSTITGKQHVYSWMLMKVADFRGLASFDPSIHGAKERLKDLALQADLLHGIPYAIVCSDITDRDVSFLNYQARHYLSHARSDDPNYRFFKVMIYQLFQLVASQRQSDLQWPGPVLNDEERLMLGLEPKQAASPC